MKTSTTIHMSRSPVRSVAALAPMLLCHGFSGEKAVRQPTIRKKLAERLGDVRLFGSS